MHYHFDIEDETLKAWTLGLGSHHLPWEEIQKTPKDNSVSFIENTNSGSNIESKMHCSYDSDA